MKQLAGRRARVKLSHDELMRRLRLGDIRKLVRDRCGEILPDDDAGREYLKEILLPISLWPYEARMGRGRIELMGPTDKMFCEIKNWAPWMSEQEAQSLVDDINLTPSHERKPMAQTLGKRLNLTYAERARLFLRTIGPCDVTEKVMALMRKQKKRKRMRDLRQKKPRAEYLAASLSQTQPWTAEGISRATYYRRIKQEQARETGMCHIKLIQTEHTLVSQEKTGACTCSECVRLPPPTPAGQTQTNVNPELLGPWIPVSEVDWLIACAMLRSSRRYGNSRPSGFNDRLIYQRVKY